MVDNLNALLANSQCAQTANRWRPIPQCAVYLRHRPMTLRRLVCHGQCTAVILRQASGAGGLVRSEYSLCPAQLQRRRVKPAQKRPKLSHRGKALAK